MPDYINLLELTELARAKFKNDDHIFGFYLSGGGSSITYRNNRKAFDEIELIPRFMMGKGNSPDTKTELFGMTLDSPIGFAPVGYMKLTQNGSEVDAAQVAKDRNILMCLSSSTTTSIDEVAGVCGNVFNQLYFFSRPFGEDFVERSENAGCKGIVITVDSPLTPKRDLYNMHGKSIGHGDLLYMPNFHESGHYKTWAKANPNTATITDYMRATRDHTLTWEDIRWLISLTDLPVIIKGILHPDDAKLAIDIGAQGIIISNHGGRQLDTSITSIDALPRIAEAVGDQTTLILDSGVRRGTDVIKALALGASAVLIGQPMLWGLVIDGQQGIADVYDMLYRELIESLVLCGYSSTDEVNKSILA